MNINNDVPQNSQLSIYGNDEALNEFPVLKAFQQYIDAEQAKAHKRVTQLCIFFTALMVIIVSVFVVLLISLSSKNSDLSGQMLALMIKERSTQQPVIIQPGQQAQPNNSADDRHIREISSLMEKMSDKMNMLESSIKGNANNIAEEESRNKSLQESLDKKSLALKKLESDVAKEKQGIESERKKIEEEKALLAKQKKELHQKEIELQRRKLYPELYDTPKKAEKTEAPTASAPRQKQPASAPQLEDDEEIDELIDMIPINYFSDEEPKEKPEKPARKATVKTASHNAAGEAKAKQAKPAAKKETSLSIDEADYSWDIPLE